MDNDKPSEKKAESSAAKPAKKAPAKKAAKSEKRVAVPSVPPAPTADFPAVTPQPLADASSPLPAQGAASDVAAVEPAPAVPSEIVKESVPAPSEDSEFVARHRAEDDVAQPNGPEDAAARADDPSDSITDAEMVQLIQTPMRTPQPSRAPIVIGIVVLLLLRRRRRRRRLRKQAAGN